MFLFNLVDMQTHLFLLYKVNEGGSLYFHRLTLSVVQSQHEVEEVGLAKVGGRLLLEVCPSKTHSAADTSTNQHHPQRGQLKINSFIKKNE